MPNQNSRRKFLQHLSATSLLLGAGPLSSLAEQTMEERIIPLDKKFSPNDKIRIGCIGLGIMGHNDIRTALKVPGVELVAVADLYDGRLVRAKELYGNDIFTTRDYNEILKRNDIDAVIVATSDNWHARATIDALKAGKHVYCEKPMVHRISEGLPMIAAEKQYGKKLQVGSQRVSSIAYAKAKELYRAGEIGKLTCIEAFTDRQSALGAWEYTMPIDGSPQTVDWNRYTKGAKQPYDPKKFFWWRNYKDFGTGVAGDLFVHLVSGIHLMTDSYGPTKIFSTGQLAYWKDGRDVPDVMTAILDYPETQNHPSFQVMLRVNFISGMGDKSITRFVGTEGALDMGGNSFSISHSLMAKAPGIGGWDTLSTYPKEMQEQIMKQYNEKYSSDDKKRASKEPIKYRTPNGYDEHLDHFINFFDSVRNNKPIVEDGTFGFRAAAPCLACNDSYFQKKIINWDPVKMKLA
jgi:predicted dehydrogenase